MAGILIIAEHRQGQFRSITLEAVAAMRGALAKAGMRGVIQAPPDIVESQMTDDTACFNVRAPHAQLFPQCSVIVHHGGDAHLRLPFALRLRRALARRRQVLDAAATCFRRHGFHEYVDTEAMFVRIFDEMRARRIIPPR